MHRMLEKVDNQDCSVYDETPAEAWHHAFLTHFNLFYSFISSYFDWLLKVILGIIFDLILLHGQWFSDDWNCFFHLLSLVYLFA